MLWDAARSIRGEKDAAKFKDYPLLQKINKSKGGFMLSRVFFLLCMFYLPLAFANSYERGNIVCSDFQDSEKTYRLQPTGGYAVSYAHCLLTRGGEDPKALSILEEEASLRNQVPAAQLLALYTATGGSMEQNNLDPNNYDEAFQAFGRVLHLISLHPDYPKDFMVTEEEYQHELEAYYYLVYIPNHKANKGIAGLHREHQLRSPTYQGDRDLNLYPRYSPYTLDSLRQTIENAEICANLPLKIYYRRLLYRQTVDYCGMMKREVDPIGWTGIANQ